MKKYLNIPLGYHIALIITMIALQLMESNVLGIAVLLELCGVIISPVFMAVLAMANAMLHDERVGSMLPGSLVRLGIIGAVRIVFYAIFAPSTVAFAVGSAVVAIAVFCLWEAIFALTDKMMKKRPVRKRKYRK